MAHSYGLERVRHAPRAIGDVPAVRSLLLARSGLQSPGAVPFSQPPLPRPKPGVRPANAVEVYLTAVFGDEARQADPLLRAHCRRRLIEL